MFCNLDTATPSKQASSKLCQREVHKKLWGGTAVTADLNWPKGYLVPWNVMPQYINKWSNTERDLIVVWRWFVHW